MSRLQLDISDFEHIKSDKNSTTLRSKKFGHTVTVAHNTVHPDTRKVLESLIPLSNPELDEKNKAKGGYVKEIHSDETEPGYTKMAHGGHPDMNEIEHGKSAYDMGLPCLNPHCKSQGKPHPNCRCYGFAEGGKVESACAKKIKHEPKCEYYAEGGDVETDTSAPPKMPSQSQGEAAQKGLNKPASDQISEGVDRLSSPSTWWAKGGQVQNESPGNMTGRAPFAEGGKPDIDENGGIRGPEPEDKGAIDHIQKSIHSILDWAKDAGESHAQSMRQYSEPVTGEKPYTPPPPAPEQAEAPQPGQVPSSIQADPNQSPASPQDASPNVSSAPPSSLQADPTAQPTQPTEAPQMPPSAPQDPLAQALPPQPAPGMTPKTPQEHAMASMADYQQDNQNMINDIAKGHITPKTFGSIWASKDLPGKLGMLFGLLIGGFDPAGKGNGAVEALHNIIQNDLQAQQHSAENSQNLLKIHQQTEMNKANISNLNADTALKAQTKAQANAMWLGYDHLARMARGLPEGSPQRQTADNTLAALAPMIQQANTTAFAKAASTEAMMKFMQPGAQNGSEGQYQDMQQRMRMSGNPMLQKQTEINDQRHIPGIQGQASGPVSPDLKQRVLNMNTLDNQLNNLKSAVDQYSNLRGNIDPKIIGPMAVKAHEAAALYNQTLDGLGMTEGRMGWLDKQIPTEPQKFMERLKGSREKLEEVSKNNKMRRDMILSGPGGLGFPSQSINTNTPAQSIPDGTTGTWKGQPVIRKNGTWIPR
jgi:hypothetical protein